MAERIETRAMLRAVINGRRVPKKHFVALQKKHLVQMRGHGPRSKPLLTEAGQRLLEQEADHG